MRRFFSRIANRHEQVFKYFLFLLTVLLIVVALPKETQFN